MIRRRTLSNWERYADAVTSEKIVTGELVRFACERYFRDFENPVLAFDVEAANRVIRFFTNFLKHSKGEWSGRPFELRPWQEFILANLFGWKLAESGLRRFRTAYIEVPRKNGKTTFASGIGLYLFFADGEPGAEVYVAATKRDQARICFGEAERMVAKSPALNSRIDGVRDNLHVLNTFSSFQPLGADANTMDGLNVHGAILDELHAHPKRDVVEIIETGTGSRRQPMIVEITTAGTNRESICWDHHTYGESIVRGVFSDDSFFAFISAIDEGDDWELPDVWEKANPNWNVSVKPDDIARLAQKAVRMPASQNSFRRLRLDEWTEQLVRWLNIKSWEKHPLVDKYGQEPVPLEFMESMVEGRPCWGSVDLSTKKDLTCWLKLFEPTEETPYWIVIPRFYIPEDNIQERVDRDKVPYKYWVEKGFIQPTPGNVVDYAFIEAQILQDSTRYEINELAYDPWNATQFALGLQESGCTCVEFRQGYASLSEPSKELERLIDGSKVFHGNNPVLKWNAGNVVVQTDPAENIKPNKANSADRIDGIVSLIMALGCALLHDSGRSIYDEESLFIIGE